MQDETVNGVFDFDLNEMFSFQELIDPEKARVYLATTERNRSIAPTRVRRHLQKMQRGEWVVSPHGVVFDRSGHLIDGAHRLTALINFGAPLPFMVTRNAENHVQAILDPSGSARTPGDWLEICGYADGKHLAAAANSYMKLTSAIRTGSYELNSHLSPYLAEKIVSNHEELEEFLLLGKRFNATLRLSGGLATGLRTILGEVSPGDAELFFDSLLTGANLDEGTSLLALRNGLGSLRGRDTRGRIPHAKGAALTIKAWNDFRRNRPRTLLRWQPSEGFPRPV